MQSAVWRLSTILGFVLVMNPVACPEGKPVSVEEKTAFLKLLETLPFKGEFPTDEAIDLVIPQTRVLLALTRKDIEQRAKELGGKHDDFMYRLLAVSYGLLDRKEPREHGVKHFAKIAHPEIKLAWAVGLFDRKAVSSEIVQFLRTALESKEQIKLLERLLGPDFDDFKKRVKEYPVKDGQ